MPHAVCIHFTIHEPQENRPYQKWRKHVQEAWTYPMVDYDGKWRYCITSSNINGFDSEDPYNWIICTCNHLMGLWSTTVCSTLTRNTKKSTSALDTPGGFPVEVMDKGTSMTWACFWLAFLIGCVWVDWGTPILVLLWIHMIYIDIWIYKIQEILYTMYTL